MNASDIQELTVARLQDAVTAMMTFEWHKKIAKLPKAERRKAKLLLVDCQEARLALENAQLGNIRNKLKKHDAALATGRDDLKRALKKLNKVKDVLNAVNAVVSIVSKIVTL